MTVANCFAMKVVVCFLALMAVFAEAAAGEIADWLSAPVLDAAGWNGYATAYRRLAEADRAIDDAWVAAAGTPAFAARCREIRAQALASFGGLPERTPLNARITGTVRRPGYRIEKLVAESRPGFRITAHVYVPENADFPAPRPAVLVPCGHTEDGKDGVRYQYAGVLLARAGFVGVVFDPVDQGERRQYPRRATCGMGHNAIGALAMLIGQSGVRVRLWDAVRMLDYLETRKDVDANRLGVLGCSGGGTMSSLLTAFDDRIRAAAPANYVSNLRRVVENCGPQDSEQLLFGQLAWGLNHLGLMLLRAPVPVVVCANHDDFFPIDGTLETMRALGRAADRLGCADRFALADVAGKHGWTRGTMTASVDWMRRWLMDVREAAPFDPGALRLMDARTPKGSLGADTFVPSPESWVTETGNVKDLPGSRSVYRVLADDLAEIERTRPHLSDAERARAAVKAAGMRPASGLTAADLSSAETNGLTVIRLCFGDQDGFMMPGVLVGRRGAKGRPLLLVGDRGRRGFVADVEAAVAEGRPALAVDLEGYGEIGVTKRRVHVGSCVDDGLGKVHYLLGSSLVGRRAEQVLAAAGELKRRFGAVPEVVADGFAAIPAAHAHAADPALVPEVRLRRPPPSWADAILRAMTEPVQWTYTDSVHGALLSYDWPELLMNTEACGGAGRMLGD